MTAEVKIAGNRPWVLWTYGEWKERGGSGLSDYTTAWLLKVLDLPNGVALDSLTLEDIFTRSEGPGRVALRELTRFAIVERHQVKWSA